jgi:hypothetical protein
LEAARRPEFLKAGRMADRWRSSGRPKAWGLAQNLPKAPERGCLNGRVSPETFGRISVLHRGFITFVLADPAVDV